MLTSRPTQYPFAKIALATTAALALGVGLSAPAHAQSVWERVALCESTGNWSINTGNTFYGGLQFTKTTWLEFGGGVYAPFAHLATKAQQIAIAQKVLVVQGPGAWPVCSVRAGLTRVTGSSVTVSRSFVRKPMTAKKLVVDGIIGPLTRAKMRQHGIYLNTKPAIKAWQSRLRVTKDGIIGSITAKAMQRWLNTH